MTALTPLHDQAQANPDAVYRKVTLRLLPFLFICYIVNYIDRANIGYAKLQFTQDLGFSDAVYGLGAGIFYIGYLLFEVPSNLYLQKIGARATLLRIMVIWGIASALTALVTTPTQLYIARFILGAAEAGFFPGIVLYLSYWFPAARRGRISSLLLMAVVVAGMLGGLMSGWIMHGADGLFGLRGWQALFILEGVPAVLLGLAVLWVLDDSPEKAKWLNPAERQVIVNDLQQDQAAKPATVPHSMLGALRDPRVYLLALAYSAICLGSGVYTAWAPSILKAAGMDNLKELGVVMTSSYVLAAIVMYLTGRSSDRRLERRWHLAIPALAAAGAILVLSLPGIGLPLTVAMLCVIAAGIYSAIPMFWTIPPTYLNSQAAAAGIAFISSIGAGLGGFAGAAVLGWIKTATGSLAIGILATSACIAVGCTLLLVCVPANLINLPRKS